MRNGSNDGVTTDLSLKVKPFYYWYLLPASKSMTLPVNFFEGLKLILFSYLLSFWSSLLINP